MNKYELVDPNKPITNQLSQANVRIQSNQYIFLSGKNKQSGSYAVDAPLHVQTIIPRSDPVSQTNMTIYTTNNTTIAKSWNPNTRTFQ